MKPQFQKAVALLLLTLLLFSLIGCEDPVCEDSFVAMDTVVTLRITGTGAGNALTACKAELLRLEELFSVTKETSDLARINQAGGQSVSVAKETVELLLLAREIASALPDTLALSVQPLVDAWGFLSQDTFTRPSPDTIASLLPLVDDGKIQIDAAASTVRIPVGMQLTLGAVAKGYAANRLSQLLSEREDITAAYLSLGGNVQTVGSKADGSPWRIGLADPAAPDALLGVVTLPSACAVVTSGSYQRYVTDADGRVYHHILDPKTGYPAETGLFSVTVVTENGGRADALSTALFLAGSEKTFDYWKSSSDFELVLVNSDGTVVITEGLEGKFSLSKDGTAAPTVWRRNG